MPKVRGPHEELVQVRPSSSALDSAHPLWDGVPLGAPLGGARAQFLGGLGVWSVELGHGLSPPHGRVSQLWKLMWLMLRQGIS